MTRPFARPVGRTAFFESLEARRLLAADWRNPLDGLDVTADGTASLQDALAIVRDIHQHGERTLPPRGETSTEPYWDVSGDNRVSLLDVLAVVKGLLRPRCVGHDVAPQGHDSPVEYYDIDVPTGDPYFDPSSEGDKKIPMTRTGYDAATGTALDNPRQHTNQITAFIDGSIVYGSDVRRALALRRHDGSGKLKMSAGDLMPLNNEETFPHGTLANENATPRDGASLFAAGDVRANENPTLASLHTLFVREHNRRVDELAQADSTLTGEERYQHARAWVGALLQHITYSEFLPLLLGENALSPYNGYDDSIDPGISTMFSGAAFRFGHSLAIPEIELLDSDDAPLTASPLPLRDAFFNPAPLKDHGIDPILRGMASQLVEGLDSQVIDDLRNFLFGPPGSGGLDLVSINIQRGRDLGLPSYNDVRRELGLPAATSFADVSSDVDVQSQLAGIYASVEAIDLWVGGLAEDHGAGGMVGETFFHIIRDQFERLRDGDRFWYENAQFQATDLAAIRAMTLKDVILQNTAITSLPSSVFTTQAVPDDFGEGGEAATALQTKFRSYNGHCNNLDQPQLGKAGTNLLQNYDPAYEDGISQPAGQDRPNAREISNAVFTQVDSVPNSAGVTQMFMTWGQLLTHDTNFSPGGTNESAGEGDDDSHVSLPDVVQDLLEQLFMLLGIDSRGDVGAGSLQDAVLDLVANNQEAVERFLRVAESALDRVGATFDDFFDFAESYLARVADESILEFVDDLESLLREIIDSDDLA